MISKVISAGLFGIDAFLVDVEVDIAQGLAHWTTVGLPESSVKESRDRIIAAIKNSGYQFERKRITINLAPADIKKEGTAFDLPMAIGLLASSNLIKGHAFAKIYRDWETSYPDVGRDLLDPALLSLKKDCFPVFPTISLHWLLTVFHGPSTLVSCFIQYLSTPLSTSTGSQ